LTVSAFGIALGLPTAILGAVTAGAILAVDRAALWSVLKSVQWAILPLVGGLFVLVEAVARTGVLALPAMLLERAAAASQSATVLAAGMIVALIGNAINNLPAGLIARSVLQSAHASPRIADAVLIGVDLGPNLSVTGSLATILWLSTIRRERQQVTFASFFKIGMLVMPPALLAALGVRLLL
jgi:arsenical pump membrane protein